MKENTMKAEAANAEAREELTVTCPSCGKVVGLLVEESRGGQRLLGVESEHGGVGGRMSTGLSVERRAGSA